MLLISSLAINCVFAPPRNKVPKADVGGPYSGIEGVTISFDGSGSNDPDHDGKIVSWLWSFGDGKSSTDQNPTHVYAQDGTYSVSLLVTDNEEATDEDTISVYVADIDPVADFSASPTSGTEPLTVTFTDLSASYDGISSRLWDFGNGETSTDQNPTHIFREGKYDISLTVKEADGDSDSITKQNYITSSRVNRPPFADAGGSYSGTEGNAISFDGSGSSDLDGTIVSWLWDFGDGKTSTEQNPTHIYNQDGTYSILLMVTDDESATDVDYTSAIIADAGPQANFNASPTSGSEPLSVAFSDASTSYDGVVSWLWDFGDGKSSTEPNPTHLYTVGSFTVSLTIEEEDGNTNTQIKQNYIYVKPPPNSPPTADFIIVSPVTPAINDIISLADNSLDIDGIITSWSWNFGDTTTSTKQNPTHRYQHTGTYTVTLIVQDNDGATSTITKQITIHEINPPVTTNDYDGLWHNIDFIINLTATDDYSGIAETYYRINAYPIKQISVDGPPIITTEGSNNTLEYWSIDKIGNEETHHYLLDIKLDKTPPTAELGEEITVAEDTPVILDALKSKDNIQINNYTWTLLDGTYQELNGPNPEYIFHTPGVYNANLTVTDDANNFALSSLIITVTDITNPTANAGDDKIINEGTNVILNGSASTDNVGIESYVWIFTDGEPQTLYGKETGYVFKNAGEYLVTLKVSDSENLSSNDTITIIVIANTTFSIDENNDSDEESTEVESTPDPHSLDISDTAVDGNNDGENNIEEQKNNAEPKANESEEHTLASVLVIAVIITMMSYGILVSRSMK